MKKLTLLLSVVLVFSLANAALAQDIISIGTTTSFTADLPDIVVSCPPSAISKVTLNNSELAFGFDNLSDVLLVPQANIAETESGTRVLNITAIVLTCDSTPEEVSVIDVSPSVILDEPIPLPENIEGLAESLSGYAIVNTTSANLRSCDSPTCTRVAIVHGGDSLIVLGRNANQSWWYVQAGDIRGWIWDDLVVLRGDLSDVPYVRTEGEPTPPTAYVGFTGNPVYDGLSSGSHMICAIQGNREYLIVGRNARNTTWLLLEALCLDGTEVTGWLSADAALIRNTGGVAVPIVSGTGN